MAKIFDDYERLNRENHDSGNKLEDRLEGAVEQTELLQDVRRRVQAFVTAYETLNEDYLKTARLLLEREDKTERQERVAANIERDYQEIYAQGHHSAGGFTAITLDDLKILLDQFPQKDF